MASGDERSTWRFLGVDGTPAELTHSPRLRTDDLFTLRRAALQGIGAVLVEFENLATALAAYDAPDYKEALRALADGAERDLRIVEGV